MTEPGAQPKNPLREFSGEFDILRAAADTDLARAYPASPVTGETDPDAVTPSAVIEGLRQQGSTTRAGRDPAAYAAMGQPPDPNKTLDRLYRDGPPSPPAYGAQRFADRRYGALATPRTDDLDDTSQRVYGDRAWPGGNDETAVMGSILDPDYREAPERQRLKTWPYWLLVGMGGTAAVGAAIELFVHWKK